MAPARTVAAAAVGLLLALTVVSSSTPAAGAPAPAPPPAIVRLPPHLAAALAPLSRQARTAITGNNDDDDDDDDDDDEGGGGGGGNPLDGLPPIQCQTIESIAASAADVVQELLALGVPPPRANAFQTTLLAAYPTFVVETRPGGITCVPTEAFSNFIVDTFFVALGDLLDEDDD